MLDGLLNILVFLIDLKLLCNMRLVVTVYATDFDIIFTYKSNRLERDRGTG